MIRWDIFKPRTRNILPNENSLTVIGDNSRLLNTSWQFCAHSVVWYESLVLVNILSTFRYNMCTDFKSTKERLTYQNFPSGSVKFVQTENFLVLNRKGRTHGFISPEFSSLTRHSDFCDPDPDPWGNPLKVDIKFKIRTNAATELCLE